MGFVEDTDSEILTFETRRESAILGTPEFEKHVFASPPFVGARDARKRISAHFMARATAAFEAGKDGKADRLRSYARQVENMSFDGECENALDRGRFVEVTKEWLRELYDFLTDHPDRMGRPEDWSAAAAEEEAEEEASAESEPEEPRKRSECPRCFEEGRGRVKGETTGGHSAPPDYSTNTPPQEVTVFKCPKCSCNWAE